MKGEFRVGEWLVRPDLNRIEREGERKAIEPKVMDVLVYLADHARQVLPRERILNAIWANTFVGDEVLSRAIGELRKALGDDAHHPTYIETIPRRGFRLIAPVVEEMRVSETRYQILEEIGHGAMGKVFLAEDQLLKRKVALKFLAEELAEDEKAKKRFIQEARAAAALDHPYVCSVHDTGELEGRAFIAMEYLQGKTLKARLEEGPLPLKETIRIASEVAEALERAHTAGIIHRDMKPANIMLTPEGHAKVMDFGLAKQVLTEDETRNDLSTTLTREGGVVGTFSYMSPEQLKGRPVDHRTDLFSFGIVLYEMLTGAHPFRKSSQVETAGAILNSDPPPLAQYREDSSDLLQQVQNKMIAKDLGQRYQSIREFLTDLSELDAHGGQVGQPLPSKGRSWQVYLTAASAALLVLAGSYWIYWMAWHRLEEAPAQRILTQFTFDEGLQMGPSWSPDGSLLAYASDRSGNFDIWVQSEEGNPIQITEGPSHNWQPDWSPDGRHIVFRSERDGGGIFVIPSSGGIARKVASFGYEPRWSPTGEKILFYSVLRRGLTVPPKLYLVDLDGNTPKEFASDFTSGTVFSLSAAWHPDGERVSTMGTYQNEWGFWTHSIHGGEPARSEITTEVNQQMEEAELLLGDFSWSPLGDALFFEGSSRAVLDLWKVSVESESLRWFDGPERVTASPARETDLKLTADGSKLAYSVRNERVHILLFPFDPVAGRVTGEGRRISSGGMTPDTLDLSRDGKRLAFATFRSTGEDKQLWTRSLESDESKVVSVGDYRFPCWSRDGTQLACRKGTNIGTKALPLNSFQAVLIPLGGGEEQILNSPVVGGANNPNDWSNDGQWILMGCRRRNHSPNEAPLSATEERPPAHICLQPVAAAPRAEEHAQIIASHPDYDLWQHRFSPDDRWILFNAVERKGARSSKLFVIPAKGGEWIAITDGEYWADKAVWALDGRAIYYVSNRGGFSNVWGVRFDPANGKAVGEPYQVTHLDSPSRQIDPDLTRMEIGVSDDRLALQIMEVSGDIWVLQDVP